MAIIVACSCGKKLKVNEALAGKTVRCPGCQQPVRIPSIGGAGRDGKDAPSEDSKAREQEAILRVEKIREERERTEEDEAAYRAEHNKVIESYDQLAGMTGKEKGKKRLLAGEQKAKVTIFTLIADFFGIIKANLLFRYIFISVLLAGVAIGSIFVFRYVGTYMGETTAAPEKPVEDRIKDLFTKAETAIEAKDWSTANDAVAEILRLDPRKEYNRDYRALCKKLEDAQRKGK